MAVDYIDQHSTHRYDNDPVAFDLTSNTVIRLQCIVMQTYKIRDKMMIYNRWTFALCSSAKVARIVCSVINIGI